MVSELHVKVSVQLKQVKPVLKQPAYSAKYIIHKALTPFPQKRVTQMKNNLPMLAELWWQALSIQL